MIAIALSLTLVLAGMLSAGHTHPYRGRSAPSAQTLFNRALDQLARTPHFEFIESDEQAVGGVKPRFAGFEYTLRYIAPDQVSVSQRRKFAGSWDSAGEWRQRGGQRCDYIVTWTCSRSRTPDVRALVASRIIVTPAQNGQFSLITSPARSGHSTVRITGRIRVEGKPPRIQFGTTVVVVRDYTYVTDLILSGGLPRTVRSTVTTGGHVFSTGRATFGYTARFSIQLPAQN